MTTSQYKNIIDWTLKHIPSDTRKNSVEVANEIFRNCGVTFLNRDCYEIRKILMKNNYMGWEECTYSEAQITANNGIATIGINNDRIVVIEPLNNVNSRSEMFSELPEESVSVTTINKLSIEELMNMNFFAYKLAGQSVSTTSPIIPKRIAQNGYSNAPYKDPEWDATLWSPYESLAIHGCGVACTSMALSCIGINKKPSDIIRAQKGSVFMDWTAHGNVEEVRSWDAVYAFLTNYQMYPTKFSPPILAVTSSSGGNHYIVVCDSYYKNKTTYFRAIDPAAPGREYDYWDSSKARNQILQYSKEPRS